jgi:hypothetical protein
VPFDVLGEQAQEDMGTHPAGPPVMQRPDLQVDRFEGPEGALDLGLVRSM